MKKLLITFGCSWTYGVGLGYKPGMSYDDFQKSCKTDINLPEEFSFRALLSKKHNYKNKNFSYGGSSNQSQFRLATEYFSSLEFVKDQQEYTEIIVLWGITSIYRTEMYLNSEGCLKNLFYGRKSFEDKFIKEYFKKTFDDYNEIRELSLKILFWDRFFNAHKVKNYWFDTFNHHDYILPIEETRLNYYKQSYEECAGTDWPSWDVFWNNRIQNLDSKLLDEINDETRFDWVRDKKNFPGFKRIINYEKDPRDLASFLSAYNGSKFIDKDTHKSNWRADVDRISYLEKIGLVNPISFHPSKEAHQQIADYLDSLIDFI